MHHTSYKLYYNNNNNRTIGRSPFKNHEPNQPSLLFVFHNLCVNMGYLEPDFNGMINEPHKNNN